MNVWVKPSATMLSPEIVKGYKHLPIEKRPGPQHNIFNAHLIENISILHLCSLLRAGFIIQLADLTSPKARISRNRPGKPHRVEYVGRGSGVICVIKILRRLLQTGLKDTKDLVDLMRYDKQPLYINLLPEEVDSIFFELKGSFELDDEVLKITPMIETFIDDQLFVIE
jgi:hypothetical protein